MEADEDGVTAKNTYGGPLLLRTEFSNTDETTYEYLYNAHGDVVTLISDGEVVATYTYDSFGNILEQTGEVDNSILYAGYQYDEETGLYYINARMYDPVTARFLQADTYLGATNDPLSLNLYTYCLNNPHKYVDPSGHFAITVAGVLAALRIGVSLFSGWMSAKAEYDRQVAEGDNNTDWTSVLFVGAANAGVSFFSFGAGSGAAMAGTGIKAVLKHVGKAMVRETAIGALTDASIETARQLITGTGITNLEYDRITEAGVYGGIAGGVGTLAGAGLQGLLNTRVARSAIEKLDTLAHKGAGAIKRAFGELATDNSGAVDLDAFKNVGKGGSSSELKVIGTYDNNNYFTRAVEFNAGSDGTGFTYKVFQRNDIDWNMVRTTGAKKGRGLTNAQAAEKYGLAPILNDGYVATLHHSQQRSVGPLFEASTRYHNISNAKKGPLHPYKGQLNPFNPMDNTARGLFQKVDSIEYWKARGRDAMKGVQ